MSGSVPQKSFVIIYDMSANTTIHQHYFKTNNGIKIHIKLFRKNDRVYFLLGSAGDRNYVTIPLPAVEDVIELDAALLKAVCNSITSFNDQLSSPKREQLKLLPYE